MSRDEHRFKRVVPIALFSFVLLGALCMIYLMIPPTHTRAAFGFHWDTGANASQPVLPALTLDSIVFAMVIYGVGSAQEGQHMIKSMLMYSSRPVHLHIICSPDVPAALDKSLSLISRPAYDIRVSFYPVEEARIRARADRAGLNSRHHAGIGGLLKMFMHEVISPDVPHALYVDTDAMFTLDPALLWRDFQRLHQNGHEHVLSLSHAGPESNGGQMCTCMMGLNLAAMRSPTEPFLSSTLLPGTNDTALGSVSTWSAAKIDPLNPPWGDQGLIWAMWQRYPERFGRLSRSWDATACGGHHGMTLDGPQDRNVTDERGRQDAIRKGDDADAGPLGIFFPGILHFNCQGTEESIFELDRLLTHNPWGPVIKVIAQYKWVWLNRGSEEDTARMTTHIESDVRFWDERRAEELGLPVSTSTSAVPAASTVIRR